MADLYDSVSRELAEAGAARASARAALEHSLRCAIDLNQADELRALLDRNRTVYLDTKANAVVTDASHIDLIRNMYAHASCTHNVEMLAVIFSLTRSVVELIDSFEFGHYFAGALTPDNARRAHALWKERAILPLTFRRDWGWDSIEALCLERVMHSGWADATAVFMHPKNDPIAALGAVCNAYSQSLRDGLTAQAEQSKAVIEAAARGPLQAVNSARVTLETLFAWGIDVSALEVLVRLIPHENPSRRGTVLDILVRRLLSTSDAFDSDQGVAFFDAVRCLPGGVFKRIALLAIGPALAFGRICIVAGFAKQMDDVVAHSALRAAIASAFAHTLFGCEQARPNLWSPLQVLVRSLGVKSVDVRFIAHTLFTDFAQNGRVDCETRAAEFLRPESLEDFLLCPFRSRRPPFGDATDGLHASDHMCWRTYHVHLGDMFVRITEVLRSAGATVVMSESHRALRATKYRALCLVVAAWLKKLGYRSVSVRCVARDMIAGWL